MKKILTLCAIMLMFCLVGCENDDNAQQTSTKHEDGSDDNVQQTPTGYEQGNVQNMYVYYNNVLYIYTGHNNDIEENEISYIYKNIKFKIFFIQNCMVPLTCNQYRLAIK